MDIVSEVINAIFIALLTSIFILGGFMMLFAYIYYSITDKLGLQHKGDDVWWNEDMYDLNRPKKTLKNMPVPFKILTILWVIGTINQLHYEFTRDDLWVRLMDFLN